MRTARRAATLLLLVALGSEMAASGARASVFGAEPVHSPRFLPTAEEMALPSERQLFNEILSEAAAAKDSTVILSVLDSALDRLPEPTQLRGYVQLSRSGLLMGERDFPEALAAIEESVRLMPGYSAPLIGAASLYAYANQPAKAADYFLRAIETDPATVRTIDEYDVDNILRRLAVAREERRLLAVSDRLLEIGWIGSSLGSQSSLAKKAIERRLRDDDIEGARALVPKLLVPGDSYALLMVTEFSPVWPEIEMWAGPKLEPQWAIYLREARQRWAASKAVETVRDYNNALLAAGHYDAVIQDVLPMLNARLDERADHDLIFVVTGVARALAQKRRWADVEALFERTQAVWPLGSQANAINIAANRARYLLDAARYEDALRQMDAAIAEARRWQVNPDALATMHHYRACILHELGRAAEAGVSMSLALAVVFPTEAATLHLCMENPAAARRVLMEALKDPQSRPGVVAFFQKQQDQPPPSEYLSKLRERAEELRRDPILLAEVAKYGRILPFSANEGAPPESR